MRRLKEGQTQPPDLRSTFAEGLTRTRYIDLMRLDYGEGLNLLDGVHDTTVPWWTLQVRLAVAISAP